MFHSGTQSFIDRWAALPGARRIPARADFDPMAFGSAVSQLFTADRRADGAVVRLAGGWVERMHDRALKGQSWPTVFRRDCRPLVSAAIVQTFREARPVVIVARATRLVEPIEIVLAPLRSGDGVADRLIGFYQPAGRPDRRAEAVGPLDAEAVIGVGEIERAALSLATMYGRRIA